MVAPLLGAPLSDELGRRGYFTETAIGSAIAEISVKQSRDAKTAKFPPLTSEEVTKAVAKFRPWKSQRARAEFTRLKEAVARGFLPKGSQLSYEIEGTSSISYARGDRNEQDVFAFVLWLNLDQNPPGDYEFNYYADIWCIPIRITKR